MKVGSVRSDLPHVRLVHADEDVLGLDVRVDDLALGVKVVEGLQNLQADHGLLAAQKWDIRFSFLPAS